MCVCVCTYVCVCARARVCVCACFQVLLYAPMSGSSDEAMG